ncbi:MAG: dihydropteroate synthase [Bacteroidales bacterium]|nr:dihydropteroate synthase [Bacteroidales bacterium]
MGILNVNSDSFHKASQQVEKSDIKTTIDKMFKDGADVIDIGAMSSRPGAKIISEKEELKRLVPVFDIIDEYFADKLFSIDTIRASVAKKAVIEHGFAIINDISGGGFDAKMFDTVAACKVPYVLMHMRGTPENMQTNTNYKALPDDIIYYLSKKISLLNKLGVNDVIIDPGFGFSKTINQNFFLLNNLSDFKIFELPILAGLSRKSMIWKTLNTVSSEALNGTSVLNTIALDKGANILRVHDVKQAKETAKLYLKTKNSYFDKN